MASRLSTRGVQPRSKQTSANKVKVQVLRDLPRVRGLRCSRARKGSSKAVSKSGRALCGREDFSFKQARPSEWKAWMALRTDMAVEPGWGAIRTGGWPGGVGEQIWAGAKGKSGSGTQPGLQVRALGRRKGANNDGRSNRPFFGGPPQKKRPSLKLH